MPALCFVCEAPAPDGCGSAFLLDAAAVRAELGIESVGPVEFKVATCRRCRGRLHRDADLADDVRRLAILRQRVILKARRPGPAARVLCS